ncbi:Molybdopterin biosynthesis protein MoeA [Rhodovulum sp. PH10]|uniref:molybdopterin molybdotransferase MoeA n=1 Tax=Rhodovulum sp. PH10 TaxID=1187851 RepID=UPI00027C2300|nr:gephyrin-like molybdotransferase Glp [Rhodovulum sp. PH10]EJW13196.1 Molybdopterin biosynthesis protein MoeA [Rhodovulum sp. PH10]
MRLDEMERLVREQTKPVEGVEEVLLRAAAGRVIAKDIAARLDLPPFDNSAVDGFAVRHADIAAGDTRLTVVDRVTAGHTATHAVGPDEAVRIFTGAPMPAGADTVVMQEHARVAGDSVTVPALPAGANRRRAGEDVAKGSVLLPAGRKLAAADVALAASQGFATLPVRRRVEVALFSTGDEVTEPGHPLAPGGIHDANRYLLMALLARPGVGVHDLGILEDDPAVLGPALEKAADAHDLVVTSGGVSSGEADHVRAAVERSGSLTVRQLDVKPGRPLGMGTLIGANGGRAIFLGLPGNPVAAFVSFAFVMRPLLACLAGATPPVLLPRTVRASFAHKKKPGRREFLRATLRLAGDGVVEAEKHPNGGSGAVVSLAESDGLVVLSEETAAVEPGMPVAFLSYAEITT